jgi:hypothetical protein
LGPTPLINVPSMLFVPQVFYPVPNEVYRDEWDDVEMADPMEYTHCRYTPVVTEASAMAAGHMPIVSNEHRLEAVRPPLLVAMASNGGHAREQRVLTRWFAAGKGLLMLIP